MKALTYGKTIDDNDTRYTTGLVRFLGAVFIYVLFGLLTEVAFASNSSPDPMQSTQGSVWLLPEDGIHINALLLETDVHFDVSGMIARATIKQRFKNTSSLWAEGVYIFPLPENAAVDHFNLRIGDRLIEGQIHERSAAKRQYETAKKEGRQAGLIEQQRANIFKTSLANVAPGEEITVEFEYQQTLEYRDGRYRLRFPMVVGPRFLANKAVQSDTVSDTEVSTTVAADKVNPVHLHVSLDPGVALAELDSTYHPIDIRQTDTHRYSIALAADKVYADRDFELVWSPELTGQPQTAVFTDHHNGNEYILLSVLPPDLQALGQQLLPRDVIFILDVSGSMAGASIEQARAALVEALGRLTPRDRFNIIWFNDRTERLYPRSMPADSEALRFAGSVVSSIDADGGTVMLPALALALNDQPDASRIRQIIFLTDGNVNNEQELFNLISKQLGDNRLFTIGIGSAPNSYFMQKAARAGRGTFTYIGDINEVRQKTSELLQKLESPALVDINVDLTGLDIEAFPDPVPDLYLGEPLTVLIRGRQLEGNINLYGNFGESNWEQKVEISDAINHPGIRTAWARSKITSLLEKHHDAGNDSEREQLKNMIINTSIDHHLISRFTSLVAVDVTPVNSSGYLYSEKLKANLPHGWKPGKTNQQHGQQMFMAQLSLPQTATTAPLHMMIAAMLFAMAMIFFLWRKLL
ncbi:MAG: marine proteobacterial sortase target protein [Gammaproteobacteria bacterium]|jgi:Ca-activated chloride channel family protein